MTAQYPPYGQGDALEQPVFAKSLLGVLGTGWAISAGRSEKWGNELLIERNNENEKHSHFLPG